MARLDPQEEACGDLECVPSGRGTYERVVGSAGMTPLSRISASHFLYIFFLAPLFPPLFVRPGAPEPYVPPSLDVARKAAAESEPRESMGDEMGDAVRVPHGTGWPSRGRPFPLTSSPHSDLPLLRVPTCFIRCAACRSPLLRVGGLLEGPEDGRG